MKVKPQECLTIDCPRWLMREMLSFGSGFRMCLTDFNRIWKGGMVQLYKRFVYGGGEVNGIRVLQEFYVMEGLFADFNG